MKSFPIYLPGDKEGALHIPSVMTRSDFDLLKRQIENALAVIRDILDAVPPAPAEAKEA